MRHMSNQWGKHATYMTCAGHANEPCFGIPLNPIKCTLFQVTYFPLPYKCVGSDGPRTSSCEDNVRTFRTFNSASIGSDAEKTEIIAACALLAKYFVKPKVPLDY